MVNFCFFDLWHRNHELCCSAACSVYHFVGGASHLIACIHHDELQKIVGIVIKKDPLFLAKNSDFY